MKKMSFIMVSLVSEVINFKIHLIIFNLIKKKELNLLINQMVNPNKLINTYVESLLSCVSLLNMRIQYRNAAEEYREYNSSELLAAYADLFIAIFAFSSKDSDFNRYNTSFSSIDKENLIKLQEIILNNMSVWLEFPGSLEFLIHNLYERCFAELYQRPAILYLLSCIIKIVSLSDKPCKDLLYKIIKPSNLKDDLLKKEKYGSSALMPKERIIETIISRNMFWDSKYMTLGNLHFIESVLSLHDYDLALAIYNVFEKNLKNIYDEIRGDIQEESLIQVYFICIIM